MKLALRWLLVAVVCLALGQGVAPARGAKRPRVTALVGWAGGDEKSGWMGVVGGCVAGRGWVGGEEAKGLMHKGERLTLYGLESGPGPVGSAIVTSDGDLHSAHPQGALDVGLYYDARVTLSPEGRKAQDTLSAVWHAPGSPEPRWAPAKILDPKSRTYGALIALWLRQHGRADWAPDVQVRQILRADVNYDGRDDVLLSFDQVDIRMLPDLTQTKPQAYLLLRYLPQGSRTPRTVVVTDSVAETLEVTGLCDLDRDGWAEVMVEESGFEWGGSWLYRWNGGRSGFVGVRGDYGGN